MATQRTPRNRWIEEGFRALAAGGPEAVRVEALAKTIGVSKGGFYWHFDNRQALLDEMLDAWERLMVTEVIERIESEGGDARPKLRQLFALAASARAQELFGAELAIRDWARRDRSVARRLKRVDNRRMDYMRSLFGEFCADEEEVEVRCLFAFSLFVGTYFVRADPRGRTRPELLQLALDRLEE